MKLFTLFALAFLLLISSLHAQEAPSREVGLRTSNLSSFGIIYKKQREPDTYRRYRLAFGNLTANFAGDNNVIGFSAGGAIGREKRRTLSEKLQFVYGTELIASVGFNSSSGGTLTVDNGAGGSITYQGANVFAVMPSVGIGFVVGAQYNFSPRWYLSAELIPSISVGGAFGSGTAVYSLQAGFNSSSAGITGAYRF